MKTHTFQTSWKALLKSQKKFNKSKRDKRAPLSTEDFHTQPIRGHYGSRPFSSQIPFQNNGVISEQIHIVQSALSSCSHYPTERERYQQSDDTLTGKLFFQG